MNNTSKPSLEKVPDSVMKLYNEINANIRFTDEISFKLLGLVPFISGAGIAGLVLSNLQSTPYGALISFFAAIVNSALFIWEYRNIQICNFWIDRLKEIERILNGTFLCNWDTRFWAVLPYTNISNKSLLYVFGNLSKI